MGAGKTGSPATSGPHRAIFDRGVKGQSFVTWEEIPCLLASCAPPRAGTRTFCKKPDLPVM